VKRSSIRTHAISHFAPALLYQAAGPASTS
jgi:hypothetical protein